MPVRMLPVGLPGSERMRELDRIISRGNFNRRPYTLPPMHREPIEQSSDRRLIDLVTRFHELGSERTRLVGVILADEGKLWLAGHLADPWGTRIRISLDEFDRLLTKAKLGMKTTHERRKVAQ